MEMLKLTCPSCAGALEVPNNLGVVHCMYCGTKIMLASTESATESEALRRYSELCKVAVQANNHVEALQYSNKILEIDLKNVEAWIDKATATFWLTTDGLNRYNNAVGYLNKAAEIAAGDARIARAGTILRILQALWYIKVGLDQFARGAFIEAMEYCLTASDFEPDNLGTLETIAMIAKAGSRIQWSERVLLKKKMLDTIKAKPLAAEKVLSLSKDLERQTTELASLKRRTDKSVLKAAKDAENRIRLLTDEIKQWQLIQQYELPKYKGK
jgi:tetratricopeptide (TPR) repeat protein